MSSIILNIRGHSLKWWDSYVVGFSLDNKLSIQTWTLIMVVARYQFFHVGYNEKMEERGKYFKVETRERYSRLHH